MKHILKNKHIPAHPGCYLMKDADGNILYVGKAKNLRKRVAWYWRATEPKTVELVSRIDDIDTIITDTEVEALILEAQLIQKYHPRYNIDLQTSGRYAFIKLTDELYPRFVIARKVEKRGNFYGPYPSAAARNAVIKSVNRIFKLCTSLIKKGMPCMRYYLEQCSGACVGKISPEEYSKSIKDAVRFLKRDFTALAEEAKKEMHDAIKKQNFEKAKLTRDRLYALQKLEHQSVSAPKKYDQDVIHFLTHAQCITIQLFHFHKGIISGRKEYSFDLKKLSAFTPQEAFSDFLRQYYLGHALPREIIIPVHLQDKKMLEEYFSRTSMHAVMITVPKKGIKAKLLALVRKNLLEKVGNGAGQLVELQEALHLEHIPNTIVCVDISTLSGVNTVGALVKFANGQPAKSGYRKFAIHSVVGVNDYAAIEELVGRYCKRIGEKKETMPDLMVIDGGKGQLHAAQKALKKSGLHIPVISLAKRLEEIFVSWSHLSLRLSPQSPALQVLRAIRDEAHRFAITYQRKKRNIIS
jgi:excinuclease ABC subunit C